MIDSYRLVYRADSMVNWCPGLGTVLANEEVTADGRSDRGNFPVFRKRLRQWMMRITAYSDRLLDDLECLDWPEKVKAMQRNWIGRSTGATALFAATTADGDGAPTSRCSPPGPTPCSVRPIWCWPPSTNWSTSWSPPAWPDGVEPAWTYGGATPGEAVAAYRRAIAAKSDLERQESREKTGVFLGSYAINPANGEPVPIFIADYVLAGYGTGAIMAVPGHDQRDWDFARQFGLPIVEVIAGGDISEAAHAGDGVLVNSGFLDGMNVAEAKQAITERLESEAGAGPVSNSSCGTGFSRASGTGVSRSRSSTTADGRAHALDEAALPVELPDMPDYSPVSFDPDDADSEPSPPLAKATEWVHVELDLGDGLKPYTPRHQRDAAVGRQLWYELRYTDPHNSERFCAKENEAYWMGPRPAEHGPTTRAASTCTSAAPSTRCLHLLYSPVLAQGSVRPGPRQLSRAISQAGQPGLHPGVRLHRRARLLRARPRK